MWYLPFLCLLIIQVVTAAPSQQDSSKSGRIVGGNATSILNYPFHVGIDYNTEYTCGGVIISRTWILTVAQCFDGSTVLGQYRVRLGTTYRDLGGITVNLSGIFRHPKYDYYDDSIDYDIALLQLAQAIPLSRSVQIARLPDSGDAIVEGSIATVIGWGAADKTGSFSTILQRAEVPILEHGVCIQLYGDLDFLVTDRMLCAGYWDGGKDACNGDAGSALIVDSRIVGLVSWGVDCGKARQPGVYTNVGVLRDWITEVTGI